MAEIDNQLNTVLTLMHTRHTNSSMLSHAANATLHFISAVDPAAGRLVNDLHQGNTMYYTRCADSKMAKDLSQRMQAAGIDCAAISFTPKPEPPLQERKPETVLIFSSSHLKEAERIIQTYTFNQEQGMQLDRNTLRIPADTSLQMMKNLTLSQLCRMEEYCQANDIHYSIGGGSSGHNTYQFYYRSTDEPVVRQIMKAAALDMEGKTGSFYQRYDQFLEQQFQTLQEQIYHLDGKTACYIVDQDGRELKLNAYYGQFHDPDQMDNQTGKERVQRNDRHFTEWYHTILAERMRQPQLLTEEEYQIYQTLHNEQPEAAETGNQEITTRSKEKEQVEEVIRVNMITGAEKIEKESESLAEKTAERTETVTVKQRQYLQEVSLAHGEPVPTLEEMQEFQLKESCLDQLDEAFSENLHLFGSLREINRSIPSRLHFQNYVDAHVHDNDYPPQMVEAASLFHPEPVLDLFLSFASEPDTDVEIEQQFERIMEGEISQTDPDQIQLLQQAHDLEADHEPVQDAAFALDDWNGEWNLLGGE